MMLRRSYSLCRFRTHVDAIEAIGCACSPGSNRTCFADLREGDSKAAAISQVCAGSRALVISPSCTVEVQRDSITPLGSCGLISLTSVSAMDYRNENRVLESVNFLNFSPSTTWRFANKNAALVGQVTFAVSPFSNAS